MICGMQHGFMKNRSCLTNLIEYMDQLTNLVDEGYSVDVTYCNFAKSFDKVLKLRLME